MDVTPTLLALLGMPIASDMDGQVLTEAISPDFLKQTPLTHIDTYDDDFELTKVEEDEPAPEELMARLRDLGYVE